MKIEISRKVTFETEKDFLMLAAVIKYVEKSVTADFQAKGVDTEEAAHLNDFVNALSEKVEVKAVGK